MDEAALYQLIVFNYYVLFEQEGIDVDYQAIVSANAYDASQTMHVWDETLNPILPAFWYILHLPRMGFDVIDNDIELVLHAHDEPHNIIPYPYTVSEPLIQQELNRGIVNPTLIICADAIYDAVIQDKTLASSVLGIVKVSELSTALMQQHWQQLKDRIVENYENAVPCVIDPSFKLTEWDERKILPLIPLANQFGYTKQLIDEVSALNTKGHHNRYVMGMRQRLLTVYRKMAENDPQFKARTEKDLIENPNFNGVPLVITLPGIMKHQKKNLKRMQQLPKVEKEVIQILGTHRAAAKNALYIEMGSISQELFTALADLESHCKDVRKINNAYVWRILKKIGKLLSQKLESHDIDIIHNVSQLTVFSDFPIGLAILPGCTSPLCCIKPISYRPLTPLTKALQYEMLKPPQIYLGKQLKIVIAECVERDDNIRSTCDALSQTLVELTKNEADVSLVIEEISSVNQFKQMLKEHTDADILLVSAHGTYHVEHNMAGLVIGDQIWMADDNDIEVPPVVLLSACHVMPRGHGVVTVGDLFVRAGAKAVLGTFIPVNVRRNATLIARLFTIIFEVRRGWSHMHTLDQIWSDVVGTNPIHEIIASSSLKYSKLEIWANTLREDGSFPQADFKNKYSVGRLRPSHAYEDTETILREIAYRDGIGAYYDAYIHTHGYFPESVFYQFIGMPENIFLRNAVMEQCAIEDDPI
ncbi:MAG: hypothetical protein PWP38_415 [Clostridiales bacterium]|jgi:hypothetical protein|nr:hypothetical protein [Clostridiales bacterium]